jgi:hypothetical protein
MSVLVKTRLSVRRQLQIGNEFGISPKRNVFSDTTRFRGSPGQVQTCSESAETVLVESPCPRIDLALLAPVGIGMWAVHSILAAFIAIDGRRLAAASPAH